MSLGVDPLISNLVFSLNLIPHLVGVRTENGHTESLREYPLVTVILAFYPKDFTGG